MTLGQKLLQARLDAGLSQRQLCGDTITRNMLSQIEHDTARPSMDTLRILAARLGRPVSYFLGEEDSTSPNLPLMLQARRAWEKGDYAEARLVLAGFQQPDPVLQWEYRHLSAAAALAAAEQALRDGKQIYARELAMEALDFGKALPGMERRCLLFLGRIPGEDLPRLCAALPSVDEELQLRAEAALAEKRPRRAIALLEAMETPTARSHLLRGLALMEVKAFSEAAQALSLAEVQFPAEAYPALEICYRELGDFRQAYRYASAQLRK